MKRTSCRRLGAYAAAFLLSICIILTCGCSVPDWLVMPDFFSVSAADVPVTPPFIVGPVDDAADHEYWHSDDDSYFSLVDEGFGTPVKMQEGGTCWLYAAATSMESCYMKEHGENIELDPMILLDNIYLDREKEGFYLREGTNAVEQGGWAWMVVESTANGYGDYVLAQANDGSNADIDTIKHMIREYGAVNVGTNDSGTKFKSSDNYFTFHEPGDNFDHEVVLIGWDDNFPADYFFTKPSRDGAWLAQNSKSDRWGVNGYYWISYESPFVEQTTFLLTDKYSRVEYYDGGKENTISTGDETTIGNVFSSEGILSAVGTYTMFPNQKLTVEVRKGEFGKVVRTVEASFEFSGYHTIELPKPFKTKGEYSICIRFENEAPVEGEDVEYGCIIYDVESEPGQSYVLVDGQWLDLADDATRSALGIDFEPNNACIKALFE